MTWWLIKAGGHYIEVEARNLQEAARLADVPDGWEVELIQERETRFVPLRTITLRCPNCAKDWDLYVKIGPEPPYFSVCAECRANGEPGGA